MKRSTGAIRCSARAVREYLEALDDEALAETLPKHLSLTDPLARWTAAPGGPAFFAYSTNCLVDTEHGVILDVEATPAHRTAEVESTKTMVPPRSSRCARSSRSRSTNSATPWTYKAAKNGPRAQDAELSDISVFARGFDQAGQHSTQAGRGG